MPNKKPAKFDFAGVCSYLGLAPDDVNELRVCGLITPSQEEGKQTYPQPMLDLVLKLLELGVERGWSINTMAWYADLTFVTEVGRSILLPIPDGRTVSANLPENWLETDYVDIVLNDLNNLSMLEDESEPLVALLRSLVLIGEGQLWPDLAALRETALSPIIQYFEQHEVKIVDQSHIVARDAGPLLLSVVLVFTVVAPAISVEFNQLLGRIQARLTPKLEPGAVQRSEKAKIRKEGLVAVDKLYAAKAVEIHAQPDSWDFHMGVLSARKQSITLQMKIPVDAADAVIDNVIDLIRPYVGAFGARVVHLLYEIANDSPYWRSPTITVNTNELLDRLGMKRSAEGFHDNKNRTRLRDVLNVAHDLEIVGEFSTIENGKVTRKQFYKTVLSLIGASFDSQENNGISAVELRRKGLPKSMQIRLNFYDGVRRPDGKLGNQYVLMPPLGDPKKLPKANHAGAYELLKAYLLFRYRQTRMVSRTLTLTRTTALEKANITNKNATRATMTLRKALNKLIQDGTLESYSTSLPTQLEGLFDITLSENVIYNR